MSRARERILGRLRAGQKAHAPDSGPLRLREDSGAARTIPLRDLDENQRLEQFVQAAEALGGIVHCAGSPGAAIETIMDLLDGDKTALAWEDGELPLADLRASLESLGVGIAAHDDESARVGITGVSAALAGTGSLALESGGGRYRATSLLPDLHIALLTPQQILPDLESWAEAQAQSGFGAFREASNTIIISGPSKTADIGHQLVKGAHGPRELHIVILAG